MDDILNEILDSRNSPTLMPDTTTEIIPFANERKYVKRYSITNKRAEYNIDKLTYKILPNIDPKSVTRKIFNAVLESNASDTKKSIRQSKHAYNTAKL